MSFAWSIPVLDRAHPTKTVASRQSVPRGVLFLPLFIHLLLIHTFAFACMSHAKTTLLLVYGHELCEKDTIREILLGERIFASF